MRPSRASRTRSPRSSPSTRSRPPRAQGFDLSEGLAHQKDAVATGHWPLYRRDPAREGVPLRLDSKEPSKPLSVLEAEETRFTTTTRKNGHLSELAQADAVERWERLSRNARDDRTT